ncbi:MAG: hypothetical protein ACKO37_03345 [Vampirovibrionales bacterium]
MPTIQELSETTTLSAGDLLPVWNTSNGSSRKISVTSLLSYFQQSFASPTVAVSLSVPSTGFNITVPTPVSQAQWLLLQPVATLATGTITLPLNTSTVDGTSVLVTSTQTITALTVAANGATAVFGAPSTMAATTPFTLRFYQATNSWYRV